MTTTKAPKPRSEKAPTVEQQALIERLAAGESMSVGKGGESDAGLPPAPVASLGLMFGRGEKLQIGGKQYNLAPFAFGVIEHGFELLAACPLILTVLAVMQSERPDEEIPLAEYAARLNERMGRDGSDSEKRLLNEPEVAEMYGAIPAALADADKGRELQGTLIAPVLLALQRNHPTLTVDDLRIDFGIDTFMLAVESILRQNSGIRRSFKTAPASAD